MPTPTQRVGANVKAELARAGKTQEFLATALGLTQGQTSRRIRGAIPFNVNELATIAQTLNVPLSALIPADLADAVDEKAAAS